MSAIAISFMCKENVEQSKKSLPSLQNSDVDVFIVDGSTTVESLDYYYHSQAARISQHVRGGPDAAAAYAFTKMLQHPDNYEFVGLHEQDVLLEPDWLGRTVSLFDAGRQSGLEVGAVSARAYEDRVLVQRDGYALMHNLGFGQIVLTRAAAEVWLRNFRTHWTTENRRLFGQLVDRDIATYWAFRYGEHALGADWGLDRVLAAHGLASLALVPTACADMLDNDLPAQGLALARHPVEALRDDAGFAKYVERARLIRERQWSSGHSGARQRAPDGYEMIFPHHCFGLGAVYAGRWRLRASAGWGPFWWEAAQPGATVTLPLVGSCQLMVCRPDARAGMIEIEAPGVFWQTTLAPDGGAAEVQAIEVRGDCQFRPVRLTALTEGVRFCGVRCRDPQPTVPSFRFDHSFLPPVE